MSTPHLVSLQQSMEEVQAALDHLQKIVGGHPKTPKPVRVPQSHLTDKNLLDQLGKSLISESSSSLRRSLGSSQGQTLTDLFSSMSRAMSRNL